MNDFETYLQKSGEVGFIEEVNGSFAYVSGLPTVRPAEMVAFEDGNFGQVLSLSRERCEVLSFAAPFLRVGERVARTNHFLEIAVGEAVLGRTIDPFCRPLDWATPLPALTEKRPLEAPPLGIAARKRITRSLQTGVTLVDLLLPLGKGQRELVVGDRKTGKTSFLLQVILTQARQKVVCIYAAVGRKRTDIKKIEEFLRREKINENVVLVAASSQDPPGLIYLAPFTALTLAEYFRDLGRDVLVILDDLSTHAKFYREVSLLGKRFPGRDSYPGDIFYLHSRLVERAGNFLHPSQGEVSITCLPVVETIEGDFTGYIQTNLMAMTDGHLYFDSGLFARGRRPAVNPFLSVTRVGRQTQTPVKRDINREVTALLALFEETSGLAHFGLSFSESIKQTMSMGERLYTLFDQPPAKIVPENAQIVLFGLVWSDFWRDKEKEEIQADFAKLLLAYETQKEVRQLFDGLVGQAPTFNQFLVLLGGKRGQILKILGKNA